MSGGWRLSALPVVDQAAIDALPREAQDEVRDALRALEQKRIHNPLLFWYPHVGQVAFLKSRASLKCFFGGNRSGKTTAGTVDDLIQACDRDSLPEHLQQFKKWEPPFEWRVVAPDFTSTMEAVIFPKFRELAPKGQLLGGSWGKAYDKQRRMLHFENGSWCQFLTYEQDVDKHAGAALKRVRFDEEPPRHIYNENLMRLIDFGGDCLFCMTPLLGMSWMYKGIWVPHQKGELTDTLVQTVDMDDNPHLDHDTKIRVLAGLSEGERIARKAGQFVHFAGLVYDQFSKPTHVIPSSDELPKEAFYFAGIDPGIRHMAAIVFGYLTGDDDLVIYDELALQGKTVAEVASAIHRLNAGRGRTPAWYVIDPASRNKNHQTGRSDQQEYNDNGIHSFPGQNSVTAGINRVKERLWPIAPDGKPLERPKLFVMARCVNLIDQFESYRWQSDRHRQESEAPEQVIKKDDHLLDALRYMVMARPYKPPHLRTDVKRTPLEQALHNDLYGPPKSRAASNFLSV